MDVPGPTNRWEGMYQFCFQLDRWLVAVENILLDID